MPARSVAQRKFMAACQHDPQHVKGQCPDMTRGQFQDFASTPEKGLPERKRNSYIRTTKKR